MKNGGGEVDRGYGVQSTDSSYLSGILFIFKYIWNMDEYVPR